MPKINIYLPDDLADAVRDTGVPVSAICQRALEQAVHRINALRASIPGEWSVDDAAERLPSFTARARTVLTLAIAHARTEDAPTIGTGHLLHGILAEGQNLALQVLHAMEIAPNRVAEALTSPDITTPEPTQGESGQGASGGAGLRFSGPAAATLELTVAEATGLGHNYVGCEHLLIALAVEPDGTGGKALRQVGADPRATRRAVTAALAGYAHLRAQPTTPDVMQNILTAVRQEIAPLAHRLTALESRLPTH